jgi:hypothetical protein
MRRTGDHVRNDRLTSNPDRLISQYRNLEPPSIRDWARVEYYIGRGTRLPSGDEEVKKGKPTGIHGDFMAARQSQ